MCPHNLLNPFWFCVFTAELHAIAPEAKLSFDQDVCHMLKNVEITLEKIVIKNN